MTNRRNNDDDPFDERGILKDGRTVRVSMMDAEAVRQRLNLHDGAGGTPGHRPGYIVSDIARAEREAAYAAYQADAENAWKNPPTGVGEHGQIGAREGDLCTINGAPGHLREDDDGELVCIPDNSAEDHLTFDTRAEAYRLYDEDVANMWRTPK